MTNRQQSRQRQRDLEKVNANLQKLVDRKPLNLKAQATRLILGCIDNDKPLERKKLETYAISICISRGNAEHGYHYFKVIESLPDVILAYDQNKLFQYVFQSSYELLAKESI